jgi:hypothetical protein
VLTSSEIALEPSSEQCDGELRKLRLDLLRQAVDIYLELAYPTKQVPPVVRRRLEWPDGCDGARVLNAAPFERTGKAPGRPSPIYALRLGNHRYPHMKLQIQPWPNDAAFMLSVNTHDQVAGVALGALDGQAFREVQAENQRLKEAIEQAWDNVGLPTFHRYLRDYIKSRGADAALDGEAKNAPGSTSPPDLTPCA